jgi:P27 family predicted phage terminase small subunit
MNNTNYPPFLAENAVKYYDILLDYVQNSAAGHEIDRFQLAVLSNGFSDYEKASKVLEAEGNVYKTKSGLIKLHPMNQVLSESLKVIRDTGGLFGISPKSREAMLKSWKLKEQPDGFDAI